MYATLSVRAAAAVGDARVRGPQVPVSSWFDDVDDAELLNLLPVFEELSRAENVYAQLDQLRGH